VSEPEKLTFDEAERLIAEIARTDGHKNQMRALAMVMAKDEGQDAIPAPLTDAEVIERLARLIRAAGPTASQLAYRRAFPASKRPINHAAPKVTETDIAPVDKSSLPRTLRDLYRMFPEIRRPGVPKGYPAKAGFLAKKEWCQAEAMKMILDREQAKMDMVAIEAAPEDSDAAE
jgi:hypothetical protein